MEWTVALANMNVPDSARTIPVRAPRETQETTQDTLLDLRFRALMSDAEWSSLPQAVRRRFTKRLSGGRTAVYAGEILETRMNFAGRCLAQLARLIGAPLPTSTDAHVPIVVTVTEDMATGGQIWTRLCTRRDGFPQIINSSKRFSGPTGIEEYLGRGLSMALTIHASNGALVFRSDTYVVRVLGFRLRLPAWLSPGVMTVSHAEIGETRFLFSLKVEHPWFGVLIDQTAAFQETVT
ncbi:hypothetical protein RHPLAN_66540 [Rhodoplanes sp. Z2-YC6860]|nr:hypothetical protein RHPLAN_66540 [Rhodoplanes sp. Z2-YC6860]